MGKGDQKSRRGKVTAGSYGKRRPRKANSVKKIPVTVMDENENKKSKVAVRQEVGYPDDKSENADPPTDVKPKAAKAKTADKPKTKKTEE